MYVLDGGDPLGENLLASPYLNKYRYTVESVEEEYVNFENTDNEQCFFWEVVNNKEESQKNFLEACKHYHDVYGVRRCVFDNF